MMTELIEKKRDGGALSTDEINRMVADYTSGAIPDYQMSAMLMAMYFKGLDRRETVDMTLAMQRSGDTIDLSGIKGVKADKHSTGGVGDKTSLALCPMLAALGVKMAKMSGRGLGHTGGTLDKLESFPGFSCELSPERFVEQVNTIGLAIAGQTADVDPADRKLYALRDVTGTVAVRGLIVSSIMSKKLAAGADVIVLDVKVGSGGFMKTEDEARLLASEMVQVGRAAGKKTVAVITDMDEPLGHNIGNALEVKEAISTLKGESGGELLELCLTLGSAILIAGNVFDGEREAKAALLETISTGKALCKLAQLVEAQGGDPNAVYDTSLLPEAPVKLEVTSKRAGYVNHIVADKVGNVCLHLGGGRADKTSVIDLSVGIVLHKKVGDAVKRGESIATIHASSGEKAAEAAEMLYACYDISREMPEKMPFIKGVVN